MSPGAGAPAPASGPQRGLILGLVAVLCVVLAAAVAAVMLQRATPFRQSRIGGPFTMQDMTGRTVTEADLRGRPSALFFGYTSCPDVCPTTLSTLTAALGRMGAEADGLTAAFVTVDPERDTPEQMRAYLSSFDPRIRGFTGTPAQVDAMADTFHILHRRVPEPEGGYSMDHTAAMFLFDGTGRLAGVVGYGEDEAAMQAKLTGLVARERGAAQRRPEGLWGGAVQWARQLCGL